jgi:hypothetical protein
MTFTFPLQWLYSCIAILGGAIVLGSSLIARWILSNDVHCSLYRLSTDHPQKTHCCSATDIMYCCQACLPMHCLAMNALLLRIRCCGNSKIRVCCLSTSLGNGLFIFHYLAIASRWPAVDDLQSGLPGGMSQNTYCKPTTITSAEDVTNPHSLVIVRINVTTIVWSFLNYVGKHQFDFC